MFIHVTHNQEESLSMADRIVVMHDGRIQQIADPLTISTRPENELVASFMGDNNIIRGTVTQRDGDRLVIEEAPFRAVVGVPGTDKQVGDRAAVAVRAAAVTVHEPGAQPADGASAVDAEVIFVEYLGDLVKLHLTAGGERLIAKVGGERYPSLRGREGETVTISWNEADVQLLGA